MCKRGKSIKRELFCHFEQLQAQRLHESGTVKESDMVRLNAFQRGTDNIPDCIRPYCEDGDNLEVVARRRVLVCTCTTAGMLYALGLRPGHFTHAFVDEVSFCLV